MLIIGEFVPEDILFLVLWLGYGVWIVLNYGVRWRISELLKSYFKLVVIVLLIALMYREQQQSVQYSESQFFGGFLFVYGVWGFLQSFISWLTMHMGLTNRQLIYKEGLIRRETKEMLLSQLETVDVNQSVLGRILGYGTLEIAGTGGSRVVFRDIDKPIHNKRFIAEAAAQRKRSDNG